MSNKAPTGEMKFAGEPTGLFINHDDALLYRSAVLSLLRGRSDPISLATAEQLMELLGEADDDKVGLVQVLRPFDECRLAQAVIDPMMKT